jgi:hypothetical protein
MAAKGKKIPLKSSTAKNKSSKEKTVKTIS